MSLITGTPLGNLDVQEDIYLDSAPHVYFQDYNATPLNNPDADGFYWNLSGTVTYPAFEVGCPTSVQFTENLTVNDVLCDNVGVKDTIQQRNSVELQLSIQSFFPFQTLRHILKFGAVTENAGLHTQKMGIGPVNNNQKWMVYCPKVYDEDTGDYIAIHMHKCKFIDAFTVTMPFGSAWTITGIKLRAFADTTKPAAQRFGMWMRCDASVI